MEYTDYAYDKSINKIIKIISWNFANSVEEGDVVGDNEALVLNSFGHKYLWDRDSLIRIPAKFKAYVEDDTACHGFGKTYQNLYFDDDTYFTDKTKKDKLWFITEDGFNVSDRDIDFTTIQPIITSTPIPKATSTYIIPPMPSLNELTKCVIHFEGRKTIITYCEKFVGVAICHENDTFDVGIGVAIAYTRAYINKLADDKRRKEGEAKNKIEVGNLVKVVDAGKNYSIYSSWVAQNIKDLTLIKNYAYNNALVFNPDRFDTFIVKYINDEKAYIQNCKNGICRLIGVEGIALVEKPESGRVEVKNNVKEWGCNIFG